MDKRKKAYRDNYIGTDEAAIVEYAGYKIKLIEGEASNIKITVKACTCERCGHYWETKNDSTVCPQCHSPYWNTPKIKKTKSSTA